MPSEEDPPCVADLGRFQALCDFCLLVPYIWPLETLVQIWHGVAGLEWGSNDDRWVVDRWLHCRDSSAQTFAHAKLRLGARNL